MSSSPNSGMPPSKLREPFYRTRKFEKYGLHFRYHVVIHNVSDWVMVTEPQIDWKPTEHFVQTTTVMDAMLEEDDTSYPIWLYGTADGPLLGLEYPQRSAEGGRTLANPCVVVHQDQQLVLRPIFHGQPLLLLLPQAIHTIQAPSEPLLLAYAGFILQSRMGKFSVTLPKPLHTHEERYGGTELTYIK